MDQYHMEELMVYAGTHPCSNVHERGSVGYRVAKMIDQMMHAGVSPSCERIFEAPEEFAEGLQDAADLAMVAFLVAIVVESDARAKKAYGRFLLPLEQRGVLASPRYVEARLALQEIFDHCSQHTMVCMYPYYQGIEMISFVPWVAKALEILDAWYVSDQSWAEEVTQVLSTPLGKVVANIQAFLCEDGCDQMQPEGIDDVDGNDGVIARIEHDEEPTAIDAQVAATAAEIEWADRVQQQINDTEAKNDCAVQNGGDGVIAAFDFNEEADAARGSMTETLACYKVADEGQEATPASPHAVNYVLLLRYGNAPKNREGWRAFEDALMKGGPLHACREDLTANGCNVELPCQAKVFCRPDVYPLVLEAVAQEDLHPFHVLITPDFEPALQETLDCLTYNFRPREKRKHRQEIDLKSPPPTQMMGLPSDDDLDIFELLEVKRTFLHFPVVSYRLATSTPSVVQSTTDGHADEHQRPLNYRRLQC